MTEQEQELYKKYIHTPTDEMYSLSDLIEKYLNDKEAWKTINISRLSKNKPLTHTVHWKKYQDLHYGKFDFVYTESVPYIDPILSKIDIGLDAIRIKNPKFFKEFPLFYMVRNDNYKKMGLYGGKEVTAGPVKYKFANGHYVTEVGTIYTDGEVVDFALDHEMSEGDNLVIRFRISDYTVTFIDTKTYNDEGKLLHSHCKVLS